PVTYRASAEAKNDTTSAMSSGSARRPSGTSALNRASRSGSADTWAVPSVRTPPGATALNRTPVWANSTAHSLVNETSAALDGEYAPVPRIGTVAAIDAMLTTEPPVADRCGTNSWVSNSGATTLTSMTWRNCSAWISPSLAGGKIPALLTSTSSES